MLAYPHTLEDFFQRTGFTRQQSFDGLGRHLFAGTLSLHCQGARFLQRLSPAGGLLPGVGFIVSSLNLGGCGFPRLQPQAAPFA